MSGDTPAGGKRWSRRVLAVLVVLGLCLGVGPRNPKAAIAAENPIVTVSRDVYGSIDGSPLWLDEFVAANQGAGRRPGVLLVHGGGWAHGSAAGFAAVARRLAEAGFAAFDVQYSLAAPGHPGLFEQPREIVMALEWLTRHAAALKLLPRLGALGSSAGGNLVARAALATGTDEVAAVVAWSGPMDLDNFSSLVDHSCQVARCAMHWLASDLLDYVGCLPHLCPRNWEQASPLFEVRSGAPPMLLFTSAHELVPLSDTRAFVSRLQSMGDRVRLVVYAGSRHAGEYASSALGPTIDFLRTELVGPNSADGGNVGRKR